MIRALYASLPSHEFLMMQGRPPGGYLAVPNDNAADERYSHTEKVYAATRVAAIRSIAGASDYSALNGIRCFATLH